MVARALHLLFFLWAFAAHATVQDSVLSGYVLELGSGEPLRYVEIENLNTGVLAESLEDGSFRIQVNKNERLRFEYPGYRTDTLVVIEFGMKRVYLTPDGTSIQLDEVQIQAMTDSRLDAEIKRAQAEGEFAETSQHRGGIRISPSRWFGQSGRQARQRYQLLLAEKERRQIDARFTREAITALTPLAGEDLDLYMTKYRPTAEFLSTANESTLQLYIIDTYAEFKTLTPEQRKEIKAPTGDGNTGNK
ncbi:carboxypeptidase-like regulatory domain-containing protein [Parapedobacter soli]|uniref:carboxypeptidase-like regulatory domain-containing protein n=1 Tax=Parapedobacter soli TaxID=416955 RepID=UPI0021C58D51|nr:carboxypeptidase-like regulatory domain-containing protein [Parapedobacter soli]